MMELERGGLTLTLRQAQGERNDYSKSVSPSPFVVSLSNHERLFDKHVMNVSKGLRVNGKRTGEFRITSPFSKDPKAYLFITFQDR